jgi:hypothetical protein
MLPPHDPHRPTERGQIHEFDIRAILDMRRRRARRTCRAFTTLLNRDPQHGVSVIEADEPAPRKTDQRVQRARSINNHKGSLRIRLA